MRSTNEGRLVMQLEINCKVVRDGGPAFRGNPSRDKPTPTRMLLTFRRKHILSILDNAPTKAPARTGPQVCPSPDGEYEQRVSSTENGCLAERVPGGTL
jgi:hypothetical protein